MTQERKDDNRNRVGEKANPAKLYGNGPKEHKDPWRGASSLKNEAIAAENRKGGTHRRP